MNIHTGEIKPLEEVLNLSKSEQDSYVPLTGEQVDRFSKMQPIKRVTAYQNDIRHKQKQIEKRRAANKRNKQSRRFV